MNTRTLWISALLLAGLAGTTRAQTSGQDTVYLALLNISQPIDIARAYLPSLEQRRALIRFGSEDSLAQLTDFILTEEALNGPDCFLPDLKLVYREYTYVLSLYCSSVVKYRNSSPYKTSSERMRGDLVFTQGLAAYLRRLTRRHLGVAAVSSPLKDKTVISAPLEEMKMDEDSLLPDEDGNSDADLEEAEPKPGRVLEVEKDPEQDEDPPY